MIVNPALMLIKALSTLNLFQPYQRGTKNNKKNLHKIERQKTTAQLFIITQNGVGNRSVAALVLMYSLNIPRFCRHR